MEPSLKIESQDNGARLDAVLARTYPRYSRVFFQKFLKRGGVTLSGTPREPSYRVRVGETFQVADFENFNEAPAAGADSGPTTHVEPDILFEDRSLLVIDKPAGLVVHPAPGHRVGTLMDWLKRHLGPSVLKVFTDPERLGLVHRLDKDTSGVLLIAKSITAQTAIARQFRDRTVEKTYAAFIEGVPSARSGVINAPVGRSRKVPTRMAVSPLGKDSETAFEVKETLKEVSQVILHPKTGRTHQIRVHVSAIGHPIVGDRLYGSKSVWSQEFDVHRPLLHAERLKVAHPDTGKPVVFHAPWPEDFHRAQNRFREAFKIAFVAVALGGFGVNTARAQDGSKTSSTAHKTTASSSSKGPSLSSEVRRLKTDLATIEDSLTQIGAALEKLNAADRLRDLERAVADLNAKAVAGSTAAEESKTQMLDVNRRAKSHGETLEQLRDQLDRLERRVIKLETAERVPAPAPAQPSK